MKNQKVLERTSLPNKAEKVWFYFSSGLMMSLCSDYISMRLLYYLEKLTTAPTVLIKMIEVAEKSLKLFVSVNSKTQTALSDSKNLYGHNIETLRIECAKYANIFNDPDISEFSNDLNDKKGTLFQYLRYGSQETTKGMSTDLDHILPTIDKIFYSSLMLMPEGARRALNFNCLLKNLLTNSQFDQTNNKDMVKGAIFYKSSFVQEYLNYCLQLDDEHQKLKDAFSKDQKNSIQQRQCL